ncbi:MAG: Do family serine endopeptidase [Chitinophagales bacterium]|nr:Do family serine endopeptidase [Chitinophagales bacterium]
MKKSNIFLLLITTVLISAITSALVFRFSQKETTTIIQQAQPVKFANLPGMPRDIPMALDFTYAARVTTPGVVHVMSKAMPQQQQQTYNPFKDFFGDDFFGGPQQRNYQHEPSMASGSGVIVSEDGYIVTNNHVIKGADEIEVVMNDNKRYSATLVGTDPSTDIAVLKVEQSNLPFIPFGNSDSIEIGAWVLAVGNPFNLASTVTAGIVSAKGRNINILESQTAIESFIQTDAAVNPGNSGGALVDIRGKLMGINTAIASPTGTYAGYSFAVPANLVKKVVNDLREFGIVQRGFLGVTIRNIDSDLAKDLDTDNFSGVYVEEVLEGSAAHDAGIKQKDVIKTINGIEVNSSPKLQEVVAQFRPGDKINVAYVREGKIKESVITLKNKNKGTEFLSKAKTDVQETLGVDFAELSKKEISDLGIQSGVKVSSINEGRIKKYTDMRPGFIITRIDKQAIATADDVVKKLQDKKGGVMIEGVYPDYPGVYYYAFGM